MPNQQVGVVEELWRYPVKSMLGEQVTASEVAQRGLLGDRAYALRDTSDGKIATAKNPRKWPNLFDYHAALISAPKADEKMPPARITLPNGTTEFDITFTLLRPGLLHVTIYDLDNHDKNDNAYAGIYLGDVVFRR